MCFLTSLSSPCETLIFHRPVLASSSTHLSTTTLRLCFANSSINRRFPPFFILPSTPMILVHFLKKKDKFSGVLFVGFLSFPDLFHTSQVHLLVHSYTILRSLLPRWVLFHIEDILLSKGPSVVFPSFLYRCDSLSSVYFYRLERPKKVVSFSFSYTHPFFHPSPKVHIFKILTTLWLCSSYEGKNDS